MRIGFVAPRVWPAVGGAETFLRDLTGELSRRHEVRVVALAAESPREETRLWDSLRAPAPFAPFRVGAVQVEPLRIDGARKAALLPLAFQVVPGTRRYAYGRARVAASSLYATVVGPAVERALGEVDVVQVWQPGFLAAAGLHAARRRGVPALALASLHPGAWGDDPASAGTYRAADRVVAQLESEATAFRELGVAAERIRVCGACSPGIDAQGGAALREAHGIAGPLVLFVGARRAYKGADVLAAAAPLLAERAPAARIAFVGPGPALRDPHPSCLDVSEVDERERAAWFDAADLVCLPSAAESFGLVVLEAWSAGKPVLTSEIAALRELVEESGGGWTAPREPAALAEALARTLADPEALAAAGARGRAHWLARYTPERVAACFERAYEEAVA